MIKGRKRNIGLIAFYVILVFLLGFFMPRQLDWNPSFSKYHHSPYGAEAVFDNIKDLFNDEDVAVVEEPLYNFLEDTTIEKSSYIIVNVDFRLDSLDLAYLYQFVGNGNNVFVAAEQFEQKFLDSLGIQLESHLNNFANVKDLDGGRSVLNILKLDSIYEFKAQWVNTYFSPADSSNTSILGLGLQDDVFNFIKIPFGKGHFYLHSFPYALTNYYLIKEETRPYLSEVFSQLPKDYDVIWDEYYKPRQASVRQSPFSVLMRYPAFRWVYWLSIGGVFLYMIFYAKRRQRAIPIINSPRNESIQFVKTLGSLYYNKGNNKDILEKKLRVFKDHVNKHYFLKDLSYSNEEAKLLSLKSGVDLSILKSIFSLANEYDRLNVISDAQLKALIKRINEFYKNSKKISK